MIHPTRVLLMSTTAAALAFAPAGGLAQTNQAHSDPAPSVQQPAPLSDSVRAAIEEALADELRGEAMYSRVLKDHGDVRPFSNVVRAERRHAAFLEDVLKARGLAVPAPMPAVEVPRYGSVQEACAGAVEFEARTVALYDRLLAAGPLPQDVKRAFDHNRRSSIDRHQPAFERCAGVAASRGAGRGDGHRAGRGAGYGHGQGHGGRGCGHCGGQS